MIRSIRVRIALAVFVTIVGLLGIQLLVVLNRIESAFRAQADQELLGELERVRSALARHEIEAMIESEAHRRTKWDQLFVEVIAPGGEVMRSLNVPASGLPAEAESSRIEGVNIREELDPTSRRGHRRIRVLQTEIDGHQVQIAESLRLFQKRYRALRQTLALALTVIALAGTAVAYGAATWVLLPLQRIAARARELGSAREGELPRTRSGDEIDALAAVLNDFLRRQRDELLRVRRLTADAAHALRTPLTAVRGTLELELGRLGRDGENLAGVLEDVDRLTRIVNELLLLEKLENQPAEDSPGERFDAAPVLRELVEHLSVLADDRGVRLHCGPLAVAPVRGSPSQLRQALVNLIDNALRHTPRGGSVEAGVHVDDGRARLSVQDSGPGLSPEELERAFERFYTRHDEGGTGLGLPIARAIARAHGGELRASSPGGARFELELPLAGDA